jgi:cell division protein FtsL
MLAFQDMELSPCPKLLVTDASRSSGERIFSRPVPVRNAVTKRNGERGAGHLKAIIWTTILVAFIYAAAMVLPILINEYQFQDGIQDIARFASVNRKTNEQIQKAVLDEAQKEDLPIQAEDIKVQNNGGNVHINVDYSVTVDLKVYQWTLNFHPAAYNASLI